VHADDQDKKTTCIFWTVLFFALLFVVIIAHFAGTLHVIPVPDLYDNHARMTYGTSHTSCTFPDTPVISSDSIVCGNYYAQSTPTIGEIIYGWSELNQFALNYLEVIPTNLNLELCKFG
jgi:hypothetical protein